MEALEENLDSKFSTIQAKNKEEILVRRMHPDRKIPTKEFKDAAGHDLYANEDKTIPARVQQVVQIGISVKLPRNTYG